MKGAEERFSARCRRDNRLRPEYLHCQVDQGGLNQPPAPSDEAYQINVEALGRLSTPEQFADIVLKSDSRGRVTRVRDVGRVEVGAADYGSTAYMDRSNAAALLIYAEPGANSLTVEHEVLSKMAQPGRPRKIDQGSLVSNQARARWASLIS
jgi:multidrug efflux pump subunit AcrB